MIVLFILLDFLFFFIMLLIGILKYYKDKEKEINDEDIYIRKIQ